MSERPKRPSTSSLNAEQWDRAFQLGAFRYVRSVRYRTLRADYIFTALDGVVEALRRLKFPDPHDPQVLGGCASTMLLHDDRVLGFLRSRNVGALDAPGERRDLFALMGLLVADDYRRKRKLKVDPEPLLTDPRRILEELDELFETMADVGRQMAAEDVLKNEMSVRFADLANPADIGKALIEDAIGTYESLLPEVEEDSVPKGVERRSIAKAAFLQLGVDDLAEQVAADGIEGELPTKDAMARALAERHAADLDTVARIILERNEGDPDFGYVTRLIPLKEVPVLDDVVAAFEGLRGHYIEARTAAFFIFGDVSASGGVVRARGRVRSFTVNPAEAGGRSQLNFKPFTDDIVITLRDGQSWAEVNARRTGDLSIVRAVLRRTAVIAPAAAVPVPSRLSTAPYDEWEPRTLWMLDFLRTELRTKEVDLNDTNMAHFISPEAQRKTTLAEGETPPRSAVEAVRLFGRQLHEHPEACARIVSGARLRDLEVSVRHTWDLGRGFNRIVRFRLSWDDDHVAVLTGTVDEKLDLAFHQTIVRLVRTAATRQIDEDGMRFTLAQIARRAEDGDVVEEDDGFFEAGEAS